MNKGFYILIFFALVFGQFKAQQTSKQQKKLQAQRFRIKKEIRQINTILFKNSNTRQNALSAVEDHQFNLTVRL